MESFGTYQICHRIDFSWYWIRCFGLWSKCYTTGELCLSPVGLSYVSKLSPKRLLGLLFGFWFGASAIANFIAGMLGSTIDKITSEHSMSYFFMIFAIIPGITALILIIMNPMLKKKMHGIN